MLGNLGAWIRDFTEDTSSAPPDDGDWARTLAGLLVEAAMADGSLDDDEKDQISAALQADLHMSASDVESIIDAAVAAQDSRIEIHGLTRSIRSETDAQDRIAIMEMAWMVVLADGELHEYESQLMRRLAGLLYVEDIDSGRAQKRARARLDAR